MTAFPSGMNLFGALLKQIIKAFRYGSFQASAQPEASSISLSCKAACRAPQQHGEETPAWLSTKRVHQAVWRCPQPAVR